MPCCPHCTKHSSPVPVCGTVDTLAFHTSPFPPSLRQISAELYAHHVGRGGMMRALAGCDSLSLVGSSQAQGSRLGAYSIEANHTCDSRPIYRHTGGPSYLWHKSGYWMIGTAHLVCSEHAYLSVRDSKSTPDLHTVTGVWSEWTGSEFVDNTEIAVLSFCDSGESLKTLHSLLDLCHCCCCCCCAPPLRCF